MFKCSGPSCPGYPYKASDRAHPASCNEPVLPSHISRVEVGKDLLLTCKNCGDKVEVPPSKTAGMWLDRHRFCEPFAVCSFSWTTQVMTTDAVANDGGALLGKDHWQVHTAAEDVSAVGVPEHQHFCCLPAGQSTCWHVCSCGAGYEIRRGFISTPATLGSQKVELEFLRGCVVKARERFHLLLGLPVPPLGGEQPAFQKILREELSPMTHAMRTSVEFMESILMNTPTIPPRASDLGPVAVLPDGTATYSSVYTTKPVHAAWCPAGRSSAWGGSPGACICAVQHPSSTFLSNGRLVSVPGGYPRVETSRLEVSRKPTDDKFQKTVFSTTNPPAETGQIPEEKTMSTKDAISGFIADATYALPDFTPQDDPEGGVLRPWVRTLPLRYQGVLISAIRGADGAPKEDPSKHLTRMLRRAILNPADERETVNPGGFFGLDKTKLLEAVREFFHSLDQYPHHYVMHLGHAFEVIGYSCPYAQHANFFILMYRLLCTKLHMNPETKEQMEARLTEDRVAKGTTARDF